MYFWKSLTIRRVALILSPILFLASKCSDTKGKNLYKIETKYGDMIVQLYDETPQHRDNFIKLVNEGFYDSLLFHRVIPEFMVQGGDPESKNAELGTRLGNGGPGYTVPAEINDTLYHKKGALAAARQGDEVNPEKRSSGSQFYIIHGKVFSESELNQMSINGTRYKQQMAQQAFMKDSSNVWITEGYKRCVENGIKDSVPYFQKKWEEGLMNAAMSADSIEFNDDQKKLYTTIGGAPHLDGDYTVFGEIVEGLNIIDSIAAVERDRSDRPFENIIFSIKPLK